MSGSETRQRAKTEFFVWFSNQSTLQKTGLFVWFSNQSIYKVYHTIPLFFGEGLHEKGGKGMPADGNCFGIRKPPLLPQGGLRANVTGSAALLNPL